jgi:transposase
MATNEITISLGLPGYRVTQQRLDPKRYDMWVEPTASAATCPCCGQLSISYHDGYERTVRDLPILGRPVSLHLFQRRFTCTPCRKPFNEPSDIVDWQQRQTRRYQNHLMLACRGRALQDVSRHQGIGSRMVERLLYRQAHHTFDTPSRRLPKRLGMDACATRKGHRYATLVVTLRTHQVFNVLEQRTKVTVGAFLAARSDRRRLQVATIARRREFRDAIHEQCPWALMVLDRFHVVHNATAALHDIRKRLARQAREADRRRLKDTRDLLGKAPEALPTAQRLAFYGVLGDFPALRLAHRLVHWLRRWYHVADVQVARSRLRAWFYRVRRANRQELDALAATIRRWQPWILSFFLERVTNGVTEGINTKSKLLKRIAYGLSSFVHLQARILLAFAPEALSPT